LELGAWSLELGAWSLELLAVECHQLVDRKMCHQLVDKIVL
jgi:hypothetical protein